MTTVVVLTAGVSQPSSSRLLADRLAEASSTALGGSVDDVRVEVIELREYAAELANHFVTGFPSATLKAVLQGVADADALVAVTPIFSASFSGLFKMFFDVLEPGTLAGKPVLIAATGGTARHSLALDHALRPLFAYLKAVVLPTGVFAAPEDWASDGELRTRIDLAAAELAVALGRVARSPRRAPDRFAEVVPFERLLAGSLGAHSRSQQSGPQPGTGISRRA
ncbi:MAG TPA: FMN reductase [Propionibacteriaceae bacterium]|nr:FMN reductase [Propionibacteriaceae bacterium]